MPIGKDSITKRVAKQTEPAEIAPAKEEKPKYVPKPFNKKTEEEPTQISAFDEIPAQEAIEQSTTEASPTEEPVVTPLEEKKSQKAAMPLFGLVG